VLELPVDDWDTWFESQYRFSTVSTSSQIAMKETCVIVLIILLSGSLKLLGQARMLEWPAERQLKKLDNVEVIDSLEKLTWLSCRGSSFSYILRAFDYSAVSNNTSALQDFIERNRGCEAYLALMLLLHAGEHVPPSIQAEILCARLAEFELADEWSWIEPEPKHCMDSYVARHLVSLGDEALPFLKPLLDRQGALTYSISYGSEASSHADGMRLRKCDMASRYVAQILGEQWRLILNFEERAAMIEGLHLSIEARLE
jgi:hypothetical protein